MAVLHLAAIFIGFQLCVLLSLYLKYGAVALSVAILFLGNILSAMTTEAIFGYQQDECDRHFGLCDVILCHVDIARCRIETGLSCRGAVRFHKKRKPNILQATLALLIRSLRLETGTALVYCSRAADCSKFFVSLLCVGDQRDIWSTGVIFFHTLGLFELFVNHAGRDKFFLNGHH